MALPLLRDSAPSPPWRVSWADSVQMIIQSCREPAVANRNALRLATGVGSIPHTERTAHRGKNKPSCWVARSNELLRCRPPPTPTDRHAASYHATPVVLQACPACLRQEEGSTRFEARPSKRPLRHHCMEECNKERRGQPTHPRKGKRRCAGRKSAEGTERRNANTTNLASEVSPIGSCRI